MEKRNFRFLDNYLQAYSILNSSLSPRCINLSPYFYKNNGDLAVIVIDMQEYFLKNFEDEGKRLRLIQNQIEILRYCKKDNIPTVVLEFDEKGTTIQEIKSIVEEIKTNVFLKKSVNNGFDNILLEKKLKELEITKVCLMGVNATACVRKTAEGAKSRGFEVITADDVIENVDNWNLFEKSYATNWFRENGNFYPSHKDLIKKERYS